jgi:hypothetical protein
MDRLRRLRLDRATHQIANRGAAFAKASEVIASITSSIRE